MKTNALTKKVVLGSALLVLLFTIGFFITKNATLKNQLSNQKLKSEMLLSAKLSLDKSVSKMNKDMEELNGKNMQLNKKIADANTNILQKNAEIEKLLKENASAKILEKKNRELESLIQQLNNDISTLNSLLTTAKAENSKLSDQLTASAKTNSGLSSDNSILKAMISDNYRTEALRGRKEKLTVNARKTNKLQVSFDLPGNVSNNVYFKVITPKGKEYISSNDLAVSVNIRENGDGLLASSNPKEIGTAGTKRVEMTFKPNEKLHEGIYQFNMYNEGRLLGSTQLRLK